MFYFFEKKLYHGKVTYISISKIKKKKTENVFEIFLQALKSQESIKKVFFVNLVIQGNISIRKLLISSNVSLLSLCIDSVNI